jgi:hypothetical protein
MKLPMRFLFAVLLAAGAFTAAGADPKKEPVPGQRQAIVVNGRFRFVPGSWAAYDVWDKRKNEHYRLTFSILGAKRHKRKEYRWMEIDAQLEKQPRVVTRLLVEETPDGPGEMADVIVQVQGYSAFRVPKKYYRDKRGSAVAPATGVMVRREVEKRTLKVNGRALPAILVEAEDSAGKEIRAGVSEECAPLGVVYAESEDLEMRLADFGLEAASRVKGPVLSFSFWLLEQVVEGMSKPASGSQQAGK